MASDQAARAGFPLLSIHLTSNRPAQFARFLDRLQAATSEMSAVEVVVKIDDNDEAMNRLLRKEIGARPFRITCLSTPLEGGFFGLWRWYDELLKASSPGAYFMVGLNDEMYFATQGWDRVLRKYVGLFPDHIFRLRTSEHRHRNYYDFWEPGFANDTSAIMTRRWLELGGGWCPCTGPDSFQQCVAYYFGWLERFNLAREYRERAIDDLSFGGSGSNAELTLVQVSRRSRGAIRAWFVLMSHRMQEEAARRARKLHAHIWAERQGSARLSVHDQRSARRIEVRDDSGSPVRKFPYRLNPIRIWTTNQVRALNFWHYMRPQDSRHGWLLRFLWYICLRYEMFDVVLQAYGERAMPAPAGRSWVYYALRRIVRRIDPPLTRAGS